MEGKIMKTVFNYTTHKSNEDYVAFRASKHDTIGTHIVLTVSKLNDHPWIKDARKAKPEIKQGYVVGGKFPGGTIILKRNKKFSISLESDTERKVIFTKSPRGGASAEPLEGFEPLTSGSSVTFQVCRDLPTTFFYQDTQDEFIGGVVFVLNNVDKNDIRKKKFHNHSDFRPTRHVDKYPSRHVNHDEDEKPKPKKEVKKPKESPKREKPQKKVQVSDDDD